MKKRKRYFISSITKEARGIKKPKQFYCKKTLQLFENYILSSFMR